jgi:hypothetical protein
MHPRVHGGLYIYIYIRCLEGIQAAVKREVVGNSGSTCNTHEVCTTHHAVEMDD